MQQIFPQELAKAPGPAVSTLLQTLAARELPLAWYPRWIYRGLSRRLSRLIAPARNSAAGSISP
jgi:hypothetical protein